MGADFMGSDKYYVHMDLAQSVTVTYSLCSCADHLCEHMFLCNLKHFSDKILRRSSQVHTLGCANQ